MVVISIFISLHYYHSQHLFDKYGYLCKEYIILIYKCDQCKYVLTLIINLQLHQHICSLSSAYSFQCLHRRFTAFSTLNAEAGYFSGFIDNQVEKGGPGAKKHITILKSLLFCSLHCQGCVSTRPVKKRQPVGRHEPHTNLVMLPVEKMGDKKPFLRKAQKALYIMKFAIYRRGWQLCTLSTA